MHDIFYLSAACSCANTVLQIFYPLGAEGARTLPRHEEMHTFPHPEQEKAG